jgi:hypothetical protein
MDLIHFLIDFILLFSHSNLNIFYIHFVLVHIVPNDFAIFYFDDSIRHFTDFLIVCDNDHSRAKF